MKIFEMIAGICLLVFDILVAVDQFIKVRDILKSNGFRWAPSVGAWQRQLNNNGKYAVERVVRELEEMEAVE